MSLSNTPDFKRDQEVSYFSESGMGNSSGYGSIVSGIKKVDAKYLGYNVSTDQYTLEINGNIETRGVITIHPRF